ncbi:hypothetical protein [Subtercola lobariae]|uniref:Uncharacterized protein n=1 Tax=Subtercola lobariae TaxID=1588641 RepID=A0A917B7F3_9MICO|nr:hypothetical protein [Subtercola lobariae]GGF27502.1 hypothetical protein GCM10011399_21000 [Subtercola lobariae]
MSNETPDPTKVRNQPSLTTSTGRVWLIMGGLFALIAAVVLFFLLPFSPHGLAAVALAVVVLLYAAMVITQLLTRRGRARLGVLAVLMLSIAAVALVSILIIAASQISV